MVQHGESQTAREKSTRDVRGPWMHFCLEVEPCSRTLSGEWPAPRRTQERHSRRSERALSDALTCDLKTIMDVAVFIELE